MRQQVSVNSLTMVSTHDLLHLGWISGIWLFAFPSSKTGQCKVLRVVTSVNDTVRCRPRQGCS